MTNDTQALLNTFGQLFQQQYFMNAALRSGHNGNGRHGRGPIRLLRFLADNDGVTNADIAEALDIRPSSVSMLVKKLEDAKLITREDSTEDKRASVISLTDDGRKLITESKDVRNDLSDTMFAALTADEQAQLSDLLTKLLASINDDAIESGENAALQAHFEKARDLRHQFRDLFGAPGFRPDGGGHHPHGPRGGFGGPRGGFGDGHGHHGFPDGPHFGRPDFH